MCFVDSALFVVPQTSMRPPLPSLPRVPGGASMGRTPTSSRSLRALCGLCVKKALFPVSRFVSITSALFSATAHSQPLSHLSLAHSFPCNGGCPPLAIFYFHFSIFRLLPLLSFFHQSRVTNHQSLSFAFSRRSANNWVVARPFDLDDFPFSSFDFRFSIFYFLFPLPEVLP